MHDPHEDMQKYLFATIGSPTGREGQIATTSIKITGLPIARVCDAVTYEDGSEASIVDGSGVAAIYEDQPLALAGSHLSNGDVITDSPGRAGIALQAARQTKVIP